MSSLFSNLFKVVLDSGALKINLNDLKALVRNSLAVGAVAGLSYFGANAAGLDMGAYTPVILMAVATSVDAAIKWIKNNNPEAK